MPVDYVGPVGVEHVARREVFAHRVIITVVRDRCALRCQSVSYLRGFDDSLINVAATQRPQAARAEPVHEVAIRNSCEVGLM